MNPSVRPLSFALLLMAVALPASAATWDADRILRQRDPEAAAAFLADAPGQARLKGQDADTYRGVFRHATDLKSVADLLRGPGRQFTMREKLRALPACEFCQDPQALQAWARTLIPPLAADRRALLRSAVLDRDTLPAALQIRLAGLGLSEAAWARMSLAQRSAVIEPWLEQEFISYMSELPRTAAEMASFIKRSDEVRLLLPDHSSTLLDERIEKLQSSVDGLEKIRARASASPDRAIRDALARAENANSLDARLSQISSLFDGLGLRDGAIRVAAPARPGQVFDGSSRDVTAGLLRGGLMSAVAGTWAGDEIAAFYRKERLDLRVERSDNDTVGWYYKGVISVNEEYIAQFLKLKNRDIRDLRTDPALLANLTAGLSPLFVHEAAHQRQEAWRRDRGLIQMRDHNAEIDAGQTAALFVLEKSARDPVFRATLVNDAKVPGPARQSLSAAERLRDLGPATYRDTVRYIYTNLPSLEGAVHETLHGEGVIGAIVDAELARRAALPADHARRLEKGRDRLGEYTDAASRLREFGKLSTPALRKFKADLGTLIDEKLAPYSVFRERQRLLDEQLEARLSGLLKNGPPPRTGNRVPSP